MKKVLCLIVMSFFIMGIFVACTKEEVLDGDASTYIENDEGMDNLTKSLAIDLSHLGLGDGEFIIQTPDYKVAPPRPEDPLALPQLDKGHWYDMEYAGFNGEKINIPESPKDGAIGKTLVTIVNGNHPYMTAYGIGAKKIADAYGMDFIQYTCDWDIDLQNQYIDEAIALQPDMIIINPLDVKSATNQLKKINAAGIPVIVSNMSTESEGMKYALAWTGPDDWGQFRMLARKLADEEDKEGGIAYLTHSVGGSVYFSRMMSVVTELEEYAPNMKTLDYQSPGFEKESSRVVVAGWIEKFGDDLNVIVCADDSAQLLGALEALKAVGREDVTLVAAGNSKDGMDAVKNGDVFAITYQSAQADGAMAVKVAVDWFNGLEIEPITYLQKHIITKEDVDDYMSAEW